MKIHVRSVLLGAVSVIGLGILASAQAARTRAKLEDVYFWGCVVEAGRTVEVADNDSVILGYFHEVGD